MSKIKILLADDHIIFRRGIISVVNNDPEIEIVAEVSDGYEVLNEIPESKPDIILLDLRMPVMDGYECFKHIKARFPVVKVIILTMNDDPHLIHELIELGCSGYLAKHTEPGDIITAIKEVHKNNYFFQCNIPEIINQVSQKKKESEDLQVLFSEKETKIIKWICEEKSNAEIGNLLYLSHRTVEGYRLKIMEKMKVKTLAGMIMYAVTNGMN